MNQVAKDERRRHIRFALTGDPEAKILDANGSEIDTIFLDVSVEGIGVLLDPAPKVGENLTLEFSGDEDSVCLQVMWINKNVNMKELSGVDGICRCGLWTNERNRDLVDVFSNINGVEIEE